MTHTRKLKIMVVDHAPFFGGVEAMIGDLIGAVDRERFELILALDSASHVEFRGAEIRRMPLPRLRNNPAAMFLAGAQLARRARDVDLIMTTTARTHAIGAVAARLANQPLIWRLADDTFPMPLAKALSRVPSRIISVSSFIAGRCSPSPEKTIIVPDGLPDHGTAQKPVFSEKTGFYATPQQTANARAKLRAQFGFAESDVVAVLIARLVRWKGHAVFVEAIKNTTVKGLIVGGEDESEGELGGKGLWAELDAIGADIQILGQRSDIDNILAASDIFVHSSTRPEPFGRAVVQAMLAGVPVVAARAGAIPEVVGHAGRLVPAGDVEALTAALEMDAATRTRLGREGRERALERFELKTITRRLEAVWVEASVGRR